MFTSHYLSLTSSTHIFQEEAKYLMMVMIDPFDEHIVLTYYSLLTGAADCQLDVRGEPNVRSAAVAYDSSSDTLWICGGEPNRRSCFHSTGGGEFIHLAGVLPISGGLQYCAGTFDNSTGDLIVIGNSVRSGSDRIFVKSRVGNEFISILFSSYFHGPTDLKSGFGCLFSLPNSMTFYATPALHTEDDQPALPGNTVASFLRLGNSGASIQLPTITDAGLNESLLGDGNLPCATAASTDGSIMVVMNVGVNDYRGLLIPPDVNADSVFEYIRLPSPGLQEATLTHTMVSGTGVIYLAADGYPEVLQYNVNTNEFSNSDVVLPPKNQLGGFIVSTLPDACSNA